MTDRTFDSNSKNPRNEPMGRSGVGNAVDSIVEAGETTMAHVGNAANEVGKHVSDAANEVGKQVSNAASGAMEAGANAANYAAEQAKSLTNEIETFARRNPLGALGGALAIGVLIGLIGGRR